MVNWSTSKKVRIYNAEKTVSLTCGSGKTGHLHIKQWYKNIL